MHGAKSGFFGNLFEVTGNVLLNFLAVARHQDQFVGIDRDRPLDSLFRC